MSGGAGVTVKPTTPDNRGHEAFEAVLESALKSVYKAAYHLTRNQDESEDLVQEAAIQAYRAFHTFEPGTNFKAWFLRILTNLFYSRHRKQKREPQRVDLEEAPDLYLYTQAQNVHLQSRNSDPATTVLSKLDMETVQTALATLPEEYRVVATMYFVDEFSYQEIADMIDCPIGTVRSRLHRARKLLQKSLWELAGEQGIVPLTEA